MKQNNNINFLFFNIKKLILPFTFLLFTICLVLFSNTNLTAAKDGLILWASAVIPSLFPFFVATELLSNTNIISFLGKHLNKIMRPLFNVPGEAAFAFVMGLISGYPVGAKIVSKFKEDGICTKEEAERMIAFTNNSGPLFIIGTVGITLFGNSTIGILLFITHFLSCITVGILLKYTSKPNISHIHSKKNVEQKKSINFSDLGEILGKSITNSISTILMIGGFVVIFSVVISILNQSHVFDLIYNIFSPIFNNLGISTEFIKPIFSGIIELTNGVSLVSNVHVKEISINIIISAFILGFGGISILLQVFSIIAKSGLSIKKYIIGKFAQGIIAAIYTYFAITFIPFFNFDIKPVFSPVYSGLELPINIFGINNYFILFVLICILVYLIFHTRKKKNKSFLYK